MSGRGGPRWVFPASLGLSALLHLIVLFVLRFESELVPVFVPGDPVVRGPPVGIVVYDIEPVDEPAGPTPEEQRSAPTPSEPQPGPAVPIPPARPEPGPPVTPEMPPPSARVPSAPSSVAERVNPRMGDPRLWDSSEPTAEAPVHRDDAVRRRPSSEERNDAVRRRITIEEWNAVVHPRLSIEEYNDSVRLAEEAAAKAVDWTVKTGDGGRWGVSPQGIHLGSFTLPDSIYFATPPGRRERAGAALRSWSEIHAQRGAMEIQEDIKDRIEAIRERKEAERRDSTRRGSG